MSFQQLLRVQNKPVHQLGRLFRRQLALFFPFSSLLLVSGLFGFYEQRAPLLVGMIVWRGAHNVLVATLYDKQVAVLYARYKPYVVIAQLLVEIFNEHVTLLCCEVPAVMINDFSIA